MSDRRLVRLDPVDTVVHECLPAGSGVMPCCGRTPFEVPFTDRITAQPGMVTCTGKAPT